MYIYHTFSLKLSLKVLITFGLAVLITACSPPASDSVGSQKTSQNVPININDAAMSNEADMENWLAFGRTYSEQRHSPLTQINETTVTELKPDWYIDLPFDHGLTGTPLVADGILYFEGSMNRTRAVNAVTGEMLWEYDPEVADNTGIDLRVGWGHSRGIGLWKDKVYIATWDGRLIAIDRTSGKEVWSVRTFDKSEALYITGAPKIFKGKVLIGNGGSEHSNSRAYVTAYDAETGDQTWRFYIVPGNPADGFESEAMRRAADTWTGEWWKLGGGGNAWHGFTYDVEFDTLYIGTGNGGPWNQKVRSPGGGDNLYLCSIVALDPDTGEYKWHYQTTPGETWDYNSTMDIVLADIEMDGKPVKAILHAPKNGFFYVIDREDGKLLSAEPFVETTWASHVDLKTGRPVEIPGSRYENGPYRVAPTSWGAHSWHAMSYNPETKLTYIPTIHESSIYSDEPFDLEAWEPKEFEGNMAVTWGVDDPNSAYGSLQAWDPVAGKAVWEIKMPGRWNAGTLTTAGNLVFQGRASGELFAYNAATGEELWRHDLGLGISAPPITYSVDGKQYISLLVGWGGGLAHVGGKISADFGWAYGAQTRRLVTYSLDGKAVLPPQHPPVIPKPIEMAEFTVDAELALAGAYEYAVRCAGCHGFNALASGTAPDLRASYMLEDIEDFDDIVRGGALKPNGMPQFSKLTDKELSQIQHYIRYEAEAAVDKAKKQ